MTIDQFNNTSWTAEMKAKYHGDDTIYPVLCVDFGEQLVGLRGPVGDADEIYWARCENVTLISTN